MTLDLALLAVLAVAALLGTASGALRQLVSLAAAALGVFAARAFTAPVGEGLARTLSPVARGFAPILLFVGTFALGSLVGAAILRGTGVARAVRGPSDRAVGALLGGAKGALAAWALLSALALGGKLVPPALSTRMQGSDFAALARSHNLIVRIDPDAARMLQRALDVAQRARAEGRLERDPDSARLLKQVRGYGAAAGGAGIDRSRAERALDDPEVRALVERLAARAPGSLPQ